MNDEPANLPPPQLLPLLGLMLERSRVGVVLLDSQAGVMWCNGAAREAGLRGGIVLSAWLMPDPDAPQAWAQLHDALQGRNAVDSVELPQAGGSGRWWRVNVQPLPAPGDGAAARMAVALQDCTAARRQRADTDLASRRMREAVATAGVGAWDYDLLTGTMHWSAETRAIHEVGADHLPDVATGLAFYDEASRPMITAAWERVVAEGTPFDLELGLITARGRSRRVRATGSAQRLSTKGGVHGESGPIVRVSGVFEDVTARSEAQRAVLELGERLRLASDAAGIGVWEWWPGSTGGAEAETIVWDERMRSLHGVAPGVTITRALWSRTVHSHDWALVQESTLALLQARVDRLDLRYRIVGHDGRERHLETFSREVGRDGRRRIIGICLDVTERAQHAQAMLDKEAAERTSRAKSEFLSRVSHELRTPLNGIVGFGQLLNQRQAELPAWSHEAIAVIRHASDHLLAVVDDMLDLAAIEAGTLRLQCAAVSLDEQVDAAMRLAAPLAAERPVRLQIWPAGAPAVWADATRLRQVLLNLLSNAIKYNRPDGEVRVSWLVQDGGVAMEVADEGVGIPEQRLDEVFQPFNRLGAETTPVPGTGLGLAISRNLIEAMGGRLQAQPGRALGTAMRLWLPLPDQASPAGEPSLPVAASAPPAPARLHVLYVEDNPINAALMREVLAVQAPHWKLVVAPDGEQGLAEAAAAPPDIVLLDINLPGISGHEVLARLRAQPATAACLCVAVSADAMPDEVRRAIIGGFDDYWTKPLHVPTLADNIARAVRHHANRSIGG